LKKYKIKNVLQYLIEHRNSIKVKIFKYFTFFSLIILTALWLFQIVNLRSFYRYMTIKNIEKTADVIEQNIVNDQISLLIKRLAINNNLSIRLVSMDDNSLNITIDNNAFSIFLSNLNYFDLNNYFNLTNKNNGTYTLIIEESTFYDDEYDSKAFTGSVPDDQTGFDDHVVFSKILYQGNAQFLFLGYAQLAPVESTINILKSQIYIVSVIFIILIVSFTTFISKKITKPLIKINDTAKLLAKGDYEVIFDANGYQEINELTNTMNYTVEELKKVDELRNELIANISHDLKTPLTLISGYSEVMRDIPSEITPDNLQIIINETNRLSQIVDDALALSKYHTKTNIIQRNIYNLTQDIVNICDRYNKLYRDQYDFVFEYHDDVMINADQLKISQVIYNLLNNALNYSVNDRKIIINQHVIGKKVRIDVINKGHKIKSDDMPYVFDRYYRSKDHHIRALAGSGLGLAIVRSIIEQHEGTCFVESDDDQTKFSFELDIAL